MTKRELSQIEIIAIKAHARFKNDAPKGKAFEREHFAYWIGYAEALHQLEHDQTGNVIAYLNLMLSARGWKEVVRIVADLQKEGLTND